MDRTNLRLSLDVVKLQLGQAWATGEEGITLAVGFTGTTTWSASLLRNSRTFQAEPTKQSAGIALPPMASNLSEFTRFSVSWGPRCI